MEEGEVRITNPITGGQKNSKLARYDLIPVIPLHKVAEVYGRGADKYDDRNWELGYAWHLSYAAAQRHLNQFWGGEANDVETGCPHLASVIFHCMALIEYGHTHPELDDRPNSEKPELPRPMITFDGDMDAETLARWQTAFDDSYAHLRTHPAILHDDCSVVSHMEAGTLDQYMPVDTPNRTGAPGGGDTWPQMQPASDADKQWQARQNTGFVAYELDTEAPRPRSNYDGSPVDDDEPVYNDYDYDVYNGEDMIGYDQSDDNFDDSIAPWSSGYMTRYDALRAVGYSVDDVEEFLTREENSAPRDVESEAAFLVRAQHGWGEEYTGVQPPASISFADEQAAELILKARYNLNNPGDGNRKLVPEPVRAPCRCVWCREMFTAAELGDPGEIATRDIGKTPKKKKK